VADIDQEIVEAFILVYSREQLNCALAQAAADLLSGVELTNISFEGGAASGRPISNSPGWLVKHLKAAIGQIDDPGRAGRATSSSFDLSKRPFST
jgi:hypothetical protein